MSNDARSLEADLSASISTSRGMKMSSPDECLPILHDESNELENNSWRNWMLLSIISIATTTGLSLALASFLIDQHDIVWFWKGTDWLLVAGLVSIVVMTVSYLTQKQRTVARMRAQMQTLRIEEEERAQRNASRLCALLKVSQYIGTELNPQNVFDCITRTCTEVFESHWAMLMLYREETRELEACSVCGNANMQMLLGTRQKIGKGIMGIVARERTSLLLGSESNLEKYLGSAYKSHPITSAMAVPIILKDQLIGVINVSSYNPETRYEEDDLRALQVFAENAGACIFNAERIELLARREKNERIIAADLTRYN